MLLSYGWHLHDYTSRSSLSRRSFLSLLTPFFLSVTSQKQEISIWGFVTFERLRNTGK